jgi:hypothetical protein
MRILVVSTPKTGNNWLKELLATIYRLPVVGLADPITNRDFELVGDDWIGHQHYVPDSKLITWLKENEVIVVTTIRHPADTLVSLCRYTWSGFGTELQEAIDQDGGALGEHVAAWVRAGFFLPLNISISWMRSGLTHVVRYENLRRDPITTLVELTNAIREVPRQEIERAVARNEIQLMREKANDDSAMYGDPRFFRTGDVGGWQTELSAEVIKVLRDVEPFPAQFAALGYTMDPADRCLHAPAMPRPNCNPFKKLIPRFDNGVPIRPIIMDLYLSLPEDVTQQWHDLSSTKAGSFYAWLNAPSSKWGDEEPVPSNLAVHLYEMWPALQTDFPNLLGRNRINFLYRLVRETFSQVDREFVLPVKERFMQWALAPAATDPYGPARAPLVTNFGHYVYDCEPEIQAAWPDLFGRDRVDFSLWFIHTGCFRYFEDAHDLVLPVLLSWTAQPPDMLTMGQTPSEAERVMTEEESGAAAEPMPSGSEPPDDPANCEQAAGSSESMDGQPDPELSSADRLVEAVAEALPVEGPESVADAMPGLGRHVRPAGGRDTLPGAPHQSQVRADRGGRATVRNGRSNHPGCPTIAAPAPQDQLEV